MIPYGITKYTPSSNLITKAIRAADNVLKASTDETGKISDPAVYDSVAGLLSPYSDDARVQSKILTLNNQKKVLQNKIDERGKSAANFDLEAQKRIAKVFSQKYSSPIDLVYTLADVNLALTEKYRTEIFEPAVGDKTVTQAMVNYYDKLHSRATISSEIVNNYTFGGPFNSDAYGWLLKTNPNDGTIVDMDLADANSIQADFMKTDRIVGKIPIYLYAYGPAGEKKAQLGTVNFAQPKGESTLSSGGALSGVMAGLERFWAGILPGVTRAERAEEQREFPLAGISFNALAVPKESVVKDGLGNYYYFDNQAKLWKADNADTLKKYLSSAGKNPSDVDNHFYRALPEFVQEYYRPENKIDSGFMGGAKPKAEIPTSVSPAPPTAPSALPWGWPPPLTPWEYSEQVRAGKRTIMKPKEFEMGRYDVGEVIAKGEEIFKGPLT